MKQAELTAVPFDVNFLIRKIDYNNNIINNEFDYFESFLFAGSHRNVDKERSILFVLVSGWVMSVLTEHKTFVVIWAKQTTS